MGHLLRAWPTWGRGGPDAQKKKTTLGDSTQQWRAYAHKTGCARLALFTGGHQKGNSGICSEDDLFIVFSSLFLASAWAPSHITALCGMVLKEGTAQSQRLLTTQELHSQLENSSWAGFTGRQH
ncbi:hypothetical protein LZ30DRAFT_748353 [Colletotrichum cereale]|nr:hypothetical protein LZ30DRAFT_748353 [Colletotrichum cereale]